MSKRKLQKFAEINTYPNVYQPSFQELYGNNHPYKGKWAQQHFNNNNPITLELACGKGEYTTGQARIFPNRNFIGIDIKGARIWRGAKTAMDENLVNVAFIRARIELITSLFAENEIAEIWITFPDPQLKKPKHRLTAATFLNNYKKILSPTATINLKTDNAGLFQFTHDILEHNLIKPLQHTNDIYNSPLKTSQVLNIKTYYEKNWLQQGLTSKYIQFGLYGTGTIVDLPDEEQ